MIFFTVLSIGDEDCVASCDEYKIVVVGSQGASCEQMSCLPTTALSDHAQNHWPPSFLQKSIGMSKKTVNLLKNTKPRKHTHSKVLVNITYIVLNDMLHLQDTTELS